MLANRGLRDSQIGCGAPRTESCPTDGAPETQDAILVRYGLAWVIKKRELVAYEAFTLEAPDHALARMLQRAPSTGIKQALHEAHHALFRASAQAVGRHVEE
jgi:hypothetical protein